VAHAGLRHGRNLLEGRGKSAGPESGTAPNGDPDIYGRGDYDPETGLSDWYDYPEGHGKPGLKWSEILKHWNAIEADLQDAGIDLSSGILRARSWRWLQVRIIGLIGKPPTFHPDGRVIAATRLGLALHPIEAPRKR